MSNEAVIIPAVGGTFELGTRAVPKPGADEILVRNRAIAINPVDWKIRDIGMFFKVFPNVLGSDVSGDVEAVGSDVTKFKVGDRVTGFAGVIYNSNPDHGAFQTHPLLRELSTTKIPDGMSYEDASVFPMAFATAGIALFADLGIPKTGLPAGERKAVLIWGASSSVGAIAVQIARDLGLTVFGIAGAKNHAYIKELGATHMFDYNDKELVSKVVKAAKTEGLAIDAVFDTIGTEHIAATVSDIVKQAGSGSNVKITSNDSWPKTVPEPEGATITWVLAFTHATDHSELGRWMFNEYLAKKLRDGSIKPAPKVQLVEGGLASVTKAANLNKEGVSGVKLVLTL